MDYIRWLTIFVWIPLAIVWVCNFKYLRKFPRTFLFCLGATVLFSVPWDIVAVKTDTWHYFDGHILGIWWLGLPIEEHLYIFTVCVLYTTIALLIRKRVKGES